MRETCAKLSPGNWCPCPPAPPPRSCSTGLLLLAGAAEVAQRVRTSASQALVWGAGLKFSIMCSKAAASCFKLHRRWLTLEQAFWRGFSIPKYNVWTLTATTACLWIKSERFYSPLVLTLTRQTCCAACRVASLTSPVRFGAGSVDTGAGNQWQCVQAFQTGTERWSRREHCCMPVFCLRNSKSH